jgi:putative FmdB family regulatory protein
MPIYNYKCPACDKAEDHFVKLSEKPEFWCSCTEEKTKMEKQVTSFTQFKFASEGGAEKGRRWQ